jgi:hypothetical protein
VASLGTLVADLSGGAEGTAVGSGAVTGDVTELSAGVALHSLGLAVTGEVVGATTLVAGCGAGVTLETTAETTLEAATAAAGRGGTGGSSGSGTGGSGVGAVTLGLLGWLVGRKRTWTYGKVTGLAAVVAAAVGTAVQAEGGAVSLDVTETLAVVALLGWVVLDVLAVAGVRGIAYSRWYGEEGRRLTRGLDVLGVCLRVEIEIGHGHSHGQG